MSPDTKRDFGLVKGEPLVIKSGRFGPYVAWGRGKTAVNAGLPKDLQEDLDALPEDLAWSLIEKKAAEKGKGSARVAKAAKATKGTKGAKGSKTAQAKGGKGGKRSASPRLKSAWNFFCDQRRPELVAVAAEKGEVMRLGDLSKHLSSEWKEMGPDARGPFEQQAEAHRSEMQADEPGTKKAKRPPSAYVLFCADHRSEVKELLQAKGVVGLGPVTQELAKRWKALSEPDRVPYESQALELRQAGGD